MDEDKSQLSLKNYVQEIATGRESCVQGWFSGECGTLIFEYDFKDGCGEKTINARMINDDGVDVEGYAFQVKPMLDFLNMALTATHKQK